MTSEPVKKQVHATRIAIRWGDMDALGHVNNTIYFRFMEQARVEWLADANILREGSVGPIIVNAHCSFMKALTYPGEVEVRTLVGAPGRSSFESYHEMRLIGPDGKPGELVYAAGGAKIVWADVAQGKSMPLPDTVRALLTA